MFERFQSQVVDSIIATMQAFREDVRAQKVDLSAGVYRDESGETPVMAAVREAQRLLTTNERSKSYVGLAGDPGFCEQLENLVFDGADRGGRAFTCQTIGGSGALRVIFDTLKIVSSEKRIHFTDPTWPNHFALCRASGFEPSALAYYRRESNSVDFDQLLSDVKRLTPNAILVLQSNCHNPTGVDMRPEQWRALSEVVARQSLFLVLDCAYHGLDQDLAKDSAAARIFLEAGCEFAVAYSCSKTFGLYRDRVGGAVFVAKDRDHVSRVRQNVLTVIRGSYSMPPHHGAAIVGEILANPDLNTLWRAELDAMRRRIGSLRAAIGDAFAARPATASFANVSQQSGMFTLLSMTEEEVATLRDRYGVYLVEGGRMNIAALNETTIAPVAAAISEVLQSSRL